MFSFASNVGTPFGKYFLQFHMDVDHILSCMNYSHWDLDSLSHAFIHAI